MDKNAQPPKEAQVGFRITAELRERIDRIHRTFGTSTSAITPALLTAWCDLVERDGRVRLPIRVEVDEERVELRAAEEQAHYHTSKSTAAQPRKAPRANAG